jgi:dTDP-4-dehydrorhamnose reductase
LPRHSPTEFDQAWTDQGLEQLKQLGIRKSLAFAPRLRTTLHAPARSSFSNKFARFAAAVAERHPWVELYTPVNEPLPTARFSGLYGHWHPHARDNLAFASALINELRATVLAMREIRAVNPCAQLLQTYGAYFEPLGPEVLNFFVENPCPPDLIGINYYVTSERYLDEISRPIQ